MIRHCIICDICGVERKQANHWFAAQQQGGEIRMSAFIPSKSARPGLKHLCGQTCLHRLVDEYLAGNMGARLPGMQVEERIYQKSPSVLPDAPNEPVSTDTAFTARVADSSLYSRKSSYEEDTTLDFESSARVIPYSPAVASDKQPEPTPMLDLSPPTAKSERKLSRPLAAAKPRNGATSATFRSQHAGLDGNEPPPPAVTGDSSGLAELERALTKTTHSLKTPLKLKTASAPEPSPESLSTASPQATPQATANVSLPRPRLTGNSLPDPSSPAAPNSSAAAAISAPAKLAQTLPPPQKTLSQRSVAGAWERARLWESQAAHQRQTTGKKAQSL